MIDLDLINYVNIYIYIDMRMGKKIIQFLSKMEIILCHWHIKKKCINDRVITNQNSYECILLVNSRQKV